MAEVLLTLVVPLKAAEAVEDLLIEHPELVAGFTSSPADGHGSGVALEEPGERVSGHAPRLLIQTVGPQEKLDAALDLLRRDLPHANLFWWMTPVIASGRVL